MRLLRNRRTAGPIAAHDSRFGPRKVPTITAAQRDAVYRQILERLGSAGDFSSFAEQDDLVAGRRLAREVADDLQLVLDAI